MNTDREQNNPELYTTNLHHKRAHEYAIYIMEAMEINIPFKIGGNGSNTALITNLPQNAVVEVPCLVDAGGITPTFVEALPEQCAALNRTGRYIVCKA